MEGKKILIKQKEIIFLYIIYAVGIAGHLITPLQNLMITLTPAALLITGAVVLYYSAVSANKRFIIWSFVAYVFTFICEVAGVKTGLIFGGYSYGSALGFKLFDVPLIIGFNWLFVILGSILVAQIITKNIFFASLLTASLSVLFDLVLEPVAIKLNYWHWDNNIIPLQNYIAWFLIAFTSSMLFFIFKVEVKSKAAVHYLFIQFAFFLILMFFI